MNVALFSATFYIYSSFSCQKRKKKKPTQNIFSFWYAQWMVLQSKRSAVNKKLLQAYIWLIIRQIYPRFLFCICDWKSISSLSQDIRLTFNFNYSIGSWFLGIKKKSRWRLIRNVSFRNLRISGAQTAVFIFCHPVPILLWVKCSINIDWASKSN